MTFLDDERAKNLGGLHECVHLILRPFTLFFADVESNVSTEQAIVDDRTLEHGFDSLREKNVSLDFWQLFNIWAEKYSQIGEVFMIFAVQICFVRQVLKIVFFWSYQRCTPFECVGTSQMIVGVLEYIYSVNLEGPAENSKYCHYRLGKIRGWNTEFRRPAVPHRYWGLL